MSTRYFLIKAAELDAGLRGAAALLHIWLSIRVSHIRRTQKILHGDGGNRDHGRHHRDPSGTAGHPSAIEHARRRLTIRNDRVSRRWRGACGGCSDD